MPTVSFWVRETSSTANATTLVVTNDPAFQLTFNSDNPDTPVDENGDVILESNSGAVDPDTWVIINGVAYQFTFDVIGRFPLPDEPSDNKVPAALQGLQVAVIDTPVGVFFFVIDGSGTQALMDDVGNGNLRLQETNEDPPPTPVCFCEGTELDTPSGRRRVETLAAGDLVLNEAGAARRILWVGRSRYSARELEERPELLPVRIPEHTFGPGRPSDDLHVSPQHRLVLEGAEAELQFGQPRVLAAAKHLVGEIAEAVEPDGGVVYFHVLLSRHEIILANGIPTESFQPARRTVEAMSGATQSELKRALDTLGLEAAYARADALPSLKRSEAELLARLMASPSAGEGASAESEARESATT